MNVKPIRLIKFDFYIIFKKDLVSSNIKETFEKLMLFFLETFLLKKCNLNKMMQI